MLWLRCEETQGWIRRERDVLQQISDRKMLRDIELDLQLRLRPETPMDEAEEFEDWYG